MSAHTDYVPGSEVWDRAWTQSFKAQRTQYYQLLRSPFTRFIHPLHSQVFLSYGPNLSPTELLMDYGFVDLANKNDKIELEAKAVGENRGSSRSFLNLTKAPAADRR